MPQTADLLFTNAHVFTADPVQPAAQAVAVVGNRIAFVGSNADAVSWRGQGTRVIDAGGNTLLPGINDAHFHLLHGSMHLDGIVFDSVRSYEALAEQVRTFAGENPDHEWLEGYQLPYNMGPGYTPLYRHHLDDIISDRPLIILAYDGHTAWANTYALKRAGIFNGGECGPNSEIVLDEHGEATGELREPGAFGHVFALLPKPDANRKRALLHKGLKQAAAFGVTSVHNMDSADDLPTLAAALEDVGELTLRIYLPFDVKPHTPFEALAHEAVAMRATYQSEMVRTGAAKFFIDGVIESYTGLLVEPYTDDPTTCGAANFSEEQYNRLVAEADRLGFQVHTHAVGDMGVRWVLNAYQAAQEANGKRDSRHRVEHIEVIHPDDLPRFAELEVLASMQPLHSPLTAEDLDVWVTRVGPQRWEYSFAWQTLRNAGARLIFGSDWPVVSQNPFLGIYMALNRKPWRPHLPDQRQTLANTLTAYTRDAAHGEFQEHVKGMLRLGYLADLTLANADMFAADPETIKEMSALVTVSDGRIVHES